MSSVGDAFWIGVLLAVIGAMSILRKRFSIDLPIRGVYTSDVSSHGVRKSKLTFKLTLTEARAVFWGAVSFMGGAILLVVWFDKTFAQGTLVSNETIPLIIFFVVAITVLILIIELFVEYVVRISNKAGVTIENDRKLRDSKAIYLGGDGELIYEGKQSNDERHQKIQ